MPAFRVLDCGLATYSYAVVLFNPVAAATDIWQLAGASGKQLKPRYIEISGTGVAARQQSVSLIKRSTATSGATNTTPTPQKADSNDAAAAGVITQWTTLPAGGVGTAIGTVDAGSFAIVVLGSLQDHYIFNYSDQTVKPVTLNSAVEFLCVNFAGVNTIATDKLDFSIWWTEQ